MFYNKMLLMQKLIKKSNNFLAILILFCFVAPQSNILIAELCKKNDFLDIKTKYSKNCEPDSYKTELETKNLVNDVDLFFYPNNLVYLLCLKIKNIFLSNVSDVFSAVLDINVPPPNR